MDQSFSIAAERLAAQHCAELTAPHRSAPDHGAGLSRFARRMALVLPDLLAGFGDDMHFAITAVNPCCGEPAQMLQGDGQGFSHVVLGAGKSGDDFVLSIERRAVFEILDRAFGGDGRIAGDLPDVLAALAPAHALPTLHIGRREDDIAMLRPFVREDAVHRLALSVRCGDSDPWTLMITMRAAMAELLAEAHAGKARRAAIAPHDAPFADIPLRLRATLIDMRLPLSRLGGLKPGDMIPVSVARSVPLTLGDTIVAHGTVGEIDDRVALQITSAFSRSAS